MATPLGDITNRDRPNLVASSSKSSGHPSRIDLPFELYVRPGQRRALTREENTTLFSIFPKTFGVAFTLLGVVIRVRDLPPRPHPSTIGGAPLYLTTDFEDATGWNNWAALPPGGGGSVLPHLNLRHSTHLEVSKCNEIVQLCVERHIPLHAIRLLFSSTLMCILSHPHPSHELPTQIGGTTCYWKMNEMENSPSAARGQVPLPGRPDNTNYSPFLRPGIIVSERDESLEPDPSTEAMTTMGVGVRDKRDRQCYVTVAEHGFQHHGAVLHPDGSQRSIVGQFAAALEDTDIGLVKIAPGIQHTNQVFNVNGTSLRLHSLAKEPLLNGELLEMDLPFDGLVSGSVVGDELTIIPNVAGLEATARPWRWIRGKWYSFNSSSAWDATEGTCGTPVLLQDTGIVAGFFRYHDFAHHLSLMVAASNIEEFFGGHLEVI